jgi:hypothetical protein
MPDTKAKEKLNPEVASIDIGVRHLRKVTFYPLSAGHQLKMTAILESVFKELVKIEGGSEESTVVFLTQVLEIVKENINTIIEMVCDEDPDALLNDLTNSQLVDVIKYVYETNYEGPLKNLLSLFQKEGEDENWSKLLLNQLSPPSAKSTDTSLGTSTKKASKKVGSPKAK